MPGLATAAYGSPKVFKKKERFTFQRRRETMQSGAGVGQTALALLERGQPSSVGMGSWPLVCACSLLLSAGFVRLQLFPRLNPQLSEASPLDVWKASQPAFRGPTKTGSSTASCVVASEDESHGLFSYIFHTEVIHWKARGDKSTRRSAFVENFVPIILQLLFLLPR